MKRIALILAALAAALLVAGCGGGSGGGSGAPASMVPQNVPFYLEANLAPGVKTSEELDELADTVLGINDVSSFIGEKVEDEVTLSKGETFDYESEIEPWIGEKGGLYLQEYDGGEFHDAGIVLETTNVGEAEEIFETRNEESPEPSEEGEFKGHRYWTTNDGEGALGFIGDFLAYGETRADFEEMVTTSEGDESLGESEKFKSAMEAAPDEGVGALYVDIGGLIEEARSSFDAETEAGLSLLGIEPREATAVATLVPHSEQVELDFTTNVTRAAESGGDAAAQLEALPATAVLGFAEPEFGKAFGEGLHEFSEQGVPGQFEPGEFESVFEQLGINFESLGESLGAISGFVEGSTARNLRGAVMVETSGEGEAKDLVTKIGLVLRASGNAGVTAIKGELAGFSVRSPDLEQPVIIGASGSKIVIAYGAKAAAQALRKQTKTLGTTADFEAAKAALGSSPINVFVDGGPALKLVDAMIPIDEREGFDEAKPYLRKIAYAALGSEAKDGVTSTKLIIGVQK